MTLDDRVTIPTRVVHHPLGDQLVLLNLDDGLYYGLDAVGRRCWELLGREGSLRAAFDVMRSEYAVPEEVLREDLLRLGRELLDCKLLDLR